MRKYCPLTKEVAFARLDKRLSDEEKRELCDSETLVEYHFSLGMWIRNTWIYNNDPERVKSLQASLDKQNDDLDADILLFQPTADFISEEILEAYQEYLKQNYVQQTPAKK